nr:achilleol B synthase-like isoform X5 [Oryza sativa Japonica Group]
MWKLKFGEGASNPLLRSSNGFLGRETWEFDPNGGSPEEHAVVERLRRDFTRNRFTQRECSDLLMRMQFAKENQVYSKHEVSNLKDSSEVTEEVLLTSLRRVLDQYSSLQAPDGYWPGGYSGILFILPLMIFALHVTKSLNDVLSSEHIREICRYIYNIQNEDGGWSTHTLGPSSMFGSCVNYATLRLLGEVLDEHNDGLSKGRAWILSHGSATVAPQWAKIYLSVIGVYDWSGNNPIIPELWLLPHFLPIHPGRFWCFCRMVYMPMSYIYAKRFIGPITPTILALREELYDVPYNKINWNNARISCCKVLNMICCWIENPNSNAFRRHVPRIHDFLWLAEDGMKSKAVLLLSKIPPTQVGDPIQEQRLYDAIDCLLSYVNKDGTLSSAESKRTTPWVEFINPSESFRNIIVDYPYVECTSSLIQALILFKGVHPGYRREEIDRIIKNGVLFIEKKQKNDGSWYGSWAVCFTYATFFAIKGLVAAGRTFQNSLSIRKACNFLLSKQLSTGGWGEDYLGCQVEEYIDSGRPHVVHTAWGMLGLIYAGQVELDPAPLYRAAKELINMQLETGEFPQQEILGSFNSSLFFNYTNYRNLFPIWALGEFHRRLLAKRA